jgi:hypothetical protein
MNSPRGEFEGFLAVAQFIFLPGRSSLCISVSEFTADTLNDVSIAFCRRRASAKSDKHLSGIRLNHSMAEHNRPKQTIIATAPTNTLVKTRSKQVLGQIQINPHIMPKSGVSWRIITASEVRARRHPFYPEFLVAVYMSDKSSFCHPIMTRKR